MGRGVLNAARVGEAVAMLPLPAMVHAEDGVVLAVNDIWLTTTGYDRAELLTIQAWTERAYGPRAAQIQAAIATQFEQADTASKGEDDVRTREGALLRWRYWSVSIGCDVRGRRLLLTTAVDRTVGFRAEQGLARRERELTRMLEHLPVGVLTFDSAGVVLSWNPEMTAILGASDDDLRGHSLPDRLVHPTVKAALHKALGGEVGTYVGPYTSVLGGRTTIGDLRFIPFQDDDGRVEGGVCFFQDIAEARANEAELRLLATAFESSEAILITDQRGFILRANLAFTELTGFSLEEVAGRQPSVLSSGRHDQAFYKGMWAKLTGLGRWSGEIWNRRKDGSVYPQRETITAVCDAYGGTTHYVAVFHDISDRKAAEAEIHRLAYFDPLTDLPNRRMLTERLPAALSLARRYEEHGALLFLDLDEFKLVNDALGHSVGDALLCTVADRIRGQLRREDLAARLGGDEFVVLLGRMPAERDEAALTVQRIAERLMDTLRLPIQVGSHMLHTDGSVGVVLFGPDVEPDGAERLLREADTAMYRAKRRLGCRICFHQPQMQDEVAARVRVEKELRAALREGQLRLFEQAQVSADGTVLGIEVLARWAHPERGLLAPGEFIPVAEASGLIVELGRWVIRAATDRWRQLEAEGRGPGWIAVNVSPREFRSAGFVEAVIEAIGPDRVPLLVEVTENVLIADVEQCIEQMRALAAEGVRFAIDDFGTGFSSLAYLQRLPIQQLKIDRSFVDGIGSPQAESIVNAVIAIGHQFGLTVVAEGVETEAQEAFLVARDCDALQGFRYGRPRPTAIPKPAAPVD